jgi:hypothetical protein
MPRKVSVERKQAGTVIADVARQAMEMLIPNRAQNIKIELSHWGAAAMVRL